MSAGAFAAMVVRESCCPSCHRDGTVTYHDPATGQWVESAATVPAHVLAAMASEHRDRVERHLWRAMASR